VHLQKGNSKHLMKGQGSTGATLETVEEEGADPPQRLVFLSVYNFGMSLTLVEEPPES